VIKLSKIILASTSPRRKELLGEETEFVSINPKLDENKIEIDNPKVLVLVSAYLKAWSVFKDHPDDTVIGADTVVVLENRILGKPHSRDEAFDYLRQLSGKTHYVLTGYAVLNSEHKIVNVCKSDVTFKTLSDEDIQKYLNTGEYTDKAGAYAIQGEGRALIESYHGSLKNIIGLPVEEIKSLI